LSSGTTITGDGTKKLVVHYSSSSSLQAYNENNTSRDQMTSQVEADMVVHGAGRVPNIDGLDLL
jgi:glutathione reductase (NADPH)